MAITDEHPLETVDHDAASVCMEEPGATKRLTNGMDTATQSEHERLVYDPRIYHSGHWLCNDLLEHQARFIDFDALQLHAVVLKVSRNASSITGWSVQEGGNNRVFTYTLDNGEKIIARLSFPKAGPAGLTTHSEVATINYCKETPRPSLNTLTWYPVQEHTTIPIPKILAWSDDADNPVGASYIIMEFAHGIALDKKWGSMTFEQRVYCLKDLMLMVWQLAKISAGVYGSIYFDSVQLPVDAKQPLSTGYVIGPSCEAQYWDCDPVHPRYYNFSCPDRGPWLDLSDYCSALRDAGLSTVPVSEKEGNSSWWHGSIEEHVHTLGAAHQMMPALIKDSKIQKVSVPMLMHPDLHGRNILVSSEDPTIITAIIDWQSSAFLPAFMYSHTTPDFVKRGDSVDSGIGMLEPSRGFFETVYYKGVAILAPALFNGIFLEHDAAWFFTLCPRILRDGAGALKQTMIDLIQNDERFPGLETALDPEFKLEATPDHNLRVRRIRLDIPFRESLACQLRAQIDGWVPLHYWERAKVLRAKIYNNLVEGVGEETANDWWPFDIPESPVASEV